MTVHHSFSGTWIKWVKGEIEISSDDGFIFNCARRSLFNDEGSLSGDFHFAVGRVPHRDRNGLVPVETFSPDHKEKIDTFLSIIREADSKGNLVFREDVEIAQDIVREAVKELGYQLAGHSVRDLLADNITWIRLPLMDEIMKRLVSDSICRLVILGW